MSLFVLIFASLLFSKVDKNSAESSKHPFARSLPSERLKEISRLTDLDRFFNETLKPINRVRVPGTKGHHEVKLFIKKQFDDLGWTVTLDEFDNDTPLGKKRFTNIIATLNPSAKKRLILAAHYDSKLMTPENGQYFLGTIDSAVPCAMLVEIARTLSPYFSRSARRQRILGRDLGYNSEKNRSKMLQPDSRQSNTSTITTQVNYTVVRNDQVKVASDTTLQMVFFDGEEAFQEWTETDSLYGARHLAKQWDDTPLPSVEKRSGSPSETMLSTINALVLLDLIGAANPRFYNSFRETSDLFQRMQWIERKLASVNEIQEKSAPYFVGSGVLAQPLMIEDDHIPFLKRNTAVLHLIPVPFPMCWHKMCDTEHSVDRETIHDLLKIFRVFVAEYFSL